MSLILPRVLTVDDSPSMRQMIALTLRSAGFEVAEARDGQEALDLSEREQFRLLLVDVNMPRLDGLSLVRALREKPAYRFTPLLMLTTETAQTRRRAALDAGASGWLVKPFQPEQLIAAVRRLLP